jgi:Domain of unknown function (DUF5658)
MQPRVTENSAADCRSDRDRRVARPVFRFRDRRTGFDRRRRSPLLSGLATHDGLFALLVLGFALLSATDWILTLINLRSGAVEANPVLASLLGIHPLLAASLKLAVTLLLVWVMWRNRAYRQVVAVSLLAFVLYLAVVLYQVAGLAMLGVI